VVLQWKKKKKKKKKKTKKRDVFPRRTEAAVADSQQNLHLIKTSWSALAGRLKGRACVL